MNKTRTIEDLAALARRESPPAFGVRAGVLARIRTQRRRPSVIPLSVFAGAAAAAAAIVIAVALHHWFGLSPDALTELAGPIQAGLTW